MIAITQAQLQIENSYCAHLSFACAHYACTEVRSRIVKVSCCVGCVSVYFTQGGQLSQEEFVEGLLMLGREHFQP